MLDTHTFQDHRMNAARTTNQSTGRGWDFRDTGRPPMWLRALAEIARPRSIIILAIMAGVLSLLWIG